MKVVYSPRYEIDIGLHVFPTAKYRLVHDRLIAQRVVDERDVVDPEPASWDDLALVHTREYLTAMRTGALTPEALRELELPWSEELVEGFRLMVGGTVATARLAVESATHDAPQGGIACHIGGGLHHAFPNHGEGFCPFNDVAVAIRVLQRDRTVERVAIVDLDVHHGNGTAFIFESDPRVFTFSMHQQHNYPMWKPRGSLDVGLSDGTGDRTFLRELDKALPVVLASQPDLIFYLAGADPYQEDQLGGLRLTKEGLGARDRMVVDAVRSSRVPLATVLAGGYARSVEDTVEIHCTTIRTHFQG